MSVRGSLRVARVAGLSIEVHFSWLLIFALLTASLAMDWLPAAVPGRPVAMYWLVGAATSFLLFVSVTLHEVAHSLVARSHGLPVRSITLFALGGISSIEREPRSPGLEFWMALVGPLASLLIGATVWIVALVTFSAHTFLTALLIYLGVTNVIVGVFNLLPAFPLDGGRMLRAAWWRLSGNLVVATRWASRIALAISALLLLGGSFWLLAGDLWDGVLFFALSWFIVSSARAELAGTLLRGLLADLVVADVMDPLTTEIPATMSVQAAIDEVFTRQDVIVAAVRQSGHLIGVLPIESIGLVPVNERGLIPVDQVMTPLGRLEMARPQESALDAFQRMLETGARYLMVAQDMSLVGVLEYDHIIRILRVRQTVGAAEPGAARSSQHAPL